VDDKDDPTPLLNVFEVGTEAGRRHFVCFLAPDRADAHGIDPRAIIGEFDPKPGGEFDQTSFVLNTTFIEMFTGYMNEVGATSPDMAREALNHANGWLYVLDPRFPGDGPTREPDAGDLLGGFSVDGEGRIHPGSFVYNEHHLWFSPASGVSGVLSDRQFYNWLHAGPGDEAGPT